MKTILATFAAALALSTAASAAEPRSHGFVSYSKKVYVKSYSAPPPAYVAIKLRQKNGI